MNKSENIPVIENWSLESESDFYKAPELKRMQICGKVYNHPDANDGKTIKTSFVKSVKGKIVHTRNSVYQLGEVDPNYKKWVEENHDKGWDWDNPIKIHTINE